MYTCIHTRACSFNHDVPLTCCYYLLQVLILLSCHSSFLVQVQNTFYILITIHRNYLLYAEHSFLASPRLRRKRGVRYKNLGTLASLVSGPARGVRKLFSNTYFLSTTGAESATAWVSKKQEYRRAAGVPLAQTRD